MNYCYIDGFVNSDIDFKFFYAVGNDSPISQTCFKIINCDQLFEVRGFDEIADKLYRKLQKGSYITIEGVLRNNYIQVKHFYITKNYFPIV